MKNGAGWLQFALKLLGIIESLLPAFLVSLNHHLRSKVTRLENELAVINYERKKAVELERIRERHAEQDDRAVIDGFLDDSTTG